MSDAEFPDRHVATRVAIVGAGQAGLAVAYFLRRAGLLPGQDFLVLDAGPRSGGAWQHRWESLRLGDTHKVHDLPGMHEMGLTFDDAPRDRPARDVVAAYYSMYEKHFDLRVARPAAVTWVDRTDDGYRLTLEPGGPFDTLDAQVLVNATGTWTNPRVPAIAGRREFGGLQVATPEWVSAEPFRGRQVAVVGGGTSALGFLDELANVGATTLWYTRREPVFVDDEPWLSETRGARAVSLQDAAARSGAILPSIVSVTGLARSSLVQRLEARGQLQRRPMFRRVVADGVIEQDGTFTYVDAIVWATGFRAELRHLEGLDLAGPSGAITVQRGQVVTEPTIYMAGYGPQASTVSSNRAGRTTAKLILGQLAERAAANSTA
ncbi:MAG: NAD(P)/FAD-dependent oxidoreductase [Demequina sp.]|jgi:cation diffusion facilitator CzcD-associated flavoprotein CzcO|nr:NAD(P)/FAD-dependent oxidoreductase [Demequina sp.]